ncbi:unnamed protein product [Bursaphelenchus xylophilus]|uniref:RNA-directed DNA polymerase n=1 Tax=Bursaphelenchus xylophilus TaxID=6326 RepID=A0A811LQ56_BURXY|nr:unnamed protein product [Bursaphelenchus xylophilus]CAG9123327.1 unnamed protein product [Bursaphelenchus xylophilus]
MILKAVDQKPDITIDELRKVLKSFETRMEDVNLGNSHDPSTSYEVNELQKYHRRPKYTPRGKTVHRNKNQTAKSAGDYTCYKCNGPHLATSCQKTNLCCAFCKKQGHNEAACLKKKARQFNNIVINNVGSGDSREYVTVGINAKVMEFRIDSGADMSIIGPEKWKALNRPPLTPFHITCSSVDGSPLTVKGSFKANLKYNGHSYTDTILVLAKKDTALLCGKASKELGVITFHNKEEANINIVDSYAQTMAVQYTDLFKEELGKCTKMQVHLQVKPNVNPVHKRARPVAIAVQDQVNTELDRLLDNGTLKKVDTSEWASPIVVAKKPGGKIRLCADYSTGLNDALADIEHPLPNMEEILSKFTGNTVFTQLDLSDAYLQLPLDEESQRLTTINTHRGLFQYTRLVFGLKPAPAIFQRTLEQALSGIPGILIYLDDILVMAPNRQLHDERLHQVLLKLENWGFRLRLTKCHFNVPEVTYLGMKITPSGIQADPTRVSSLQNMRIPKDQKDVRSLLGLINYYGKFIRDLHIYKAPLEQLLHKEKIFKWTPTHTRAFTQIKKVLSSPLLLAHYDPRQQLIVAADACQYGIGGVLLQRYTDGSEKAVFHISKSLTPSQQNYSQIEKEAFALVTTVERLHKFVWGRKFILQTDHRPLLTLLNPSNTKGLSDRTAARLRRWALRLIGYDFTIEYIKTDQFGQADCLSRLIQAARSDEDPELETVIASFEVLEREINEVITENLSTYTTQSEFIQATKADPLFQTLIQRISKGWKTSDKDDPLLRPYVLIKDSLSEVKGILLYDDRVMIPKAYRKKVIEKLHQAHPGITRMKKLARSHFYWPQMGKDIEMAVKGCQHCIDTANTPRKIPLQPWPETQKPWSRIHLDFAEPKKGHQFLIVVDSYSKLLDAHWMNPADSKNLIAYLHILFRHFGAPETLVTDNGGQFISEEFAKFCQDLQIVHLKSAPRMPQSNGHAERSVQTLKKSLEANKSSLDTAVLTYNYTPNEALDGRTPNEVFFGRQLRTPFDVFKPNSPHFPNMDKSDDITQLNRSQKIMKKKFDSHHGARPRFFTKGEMVTIQLVTGKRVTGKLIQFLGKTMAKVQVQDQVHTRHFNQIWKRFPYEYDTMVEEENNTPPVVPNRSNGPDAPPTVARRIQPSRNAKKPLDYQQLSGRRQKAKQ